MKKEGILARNLPPQTFQNGERLLGVSRLGVPKGREATLPLAQGGIVAQCNLLITTLWGHLAWREWGGIMQPFMFFPRVGSSRLLVASASSP